MSFEGRAHGLFAQVDENTSFTDRNIVLLALGNLRIFDDIESFCSPARKHTYRNPAAE